MDKEVIFPNLPHFVLSLQLKFAHLSKIMNKCVFVMWHWSKSLQTRCYLLTTGFLEQEKSMWTKRWGLRQIRSIFLSWGLRCKNDKSKAKDLFVLEAVSHQSKRSVQFTDQMLWITDKLSNFTNYTARNSCGPPAIYHLCLGLIIWTECWSSTKQPLSIQHLQLCALSACYYYARCAMACSLSCVY